MHPNERTTIPKTLWGLLSGLVLIGLNWTNLPAQSQVSPGQWNSIYVDHVSTNQGLSQVTALVTLQDRLGFIWIGTQNGLNRYDGYNMKIYTHRDDDTTSVGGNFIYSLFEDSKGFIWVGTRDNGLSVFDPQTEIFSHYKNIPDDEGSLSDNFIHSIYEDSKGIIWVGTWNGGLNALDPKTGKITRYTSDPNAKNGLRSKTITSITEDSKGNLWIGTFGGGLNQLDPQRKSFKHYVNEPDHPNSIASNRVISLYKDPTEKDVLWIGTIDGGLNRFDIQTGQFRSYQKQEGIPYSAPSNRFHGICADPYDHEYLWLGTWDAGLSLFNKKTGQFKNFGFNLEDPNAIGAFMLFGISADRSGNIWIGSQGDGVNKIDRSKQVFEYWNAVKYGYQYIKGKEISAIIEEKSGKGAWIGTADDGLHYINYEQKTHQHFMQLPGTDAALQQYHVHALLEDRKGQIWVGLSGNNLYVRRVGATTFQLAEELTCVSKNKDEKTDIRTLYEDGKGQIWVGALSKGLFSISSGQNTCKQYANSTENPDVIGSNDILCINEDSKGHLWVGTRTGGLNLYNPAKDRFVIYKNDPKNALSLSNNSVNGITTSSRYADLLIIATSGGICLLNLKQDLLTNPAQVVFSRISSDKGLHDNTIYTIEEDENGYFWASTTKGLFLMELKQSGGVYQMKVLRHYDKSDGLQNNELNANASFNNRKGELFFGGVDGLNIIRKYEPADEAENVPVSITRFEKYSKSGAVEISGIAHQNQIVLSYNENTFSVEFAVLNFRNTLKNRYAYRLEGESNDWIELGERRRLTFANLGPGRYTLQIKASYDGGTWSGVTSLKIVIRPPWWRSNLAFLVYICMLAGAIALWRKYERKRLHIANELKLQASRAEQLKEIDRLKSEFFANISHEFRTPLTLILGPLNQLIEGKLKGNIQQEYTLMRNNAQRLKKLIDQMLDLSKLDAGKYEIQKKQSDIVAFVKGMSSVFLPLAERRQIRFEVDSDFSAYLFDFDQELMENILLNLLSNAFKFTPDNGQITIKITEDKAENPETRAKLKLTVADTGVGISEENIPFVFDRFYKTPQSHIETGTGIGLALVKELVILHGGTIIARSELGKGSAFEILLPHELQHVEHSSSPLEQPDLNQATSLSELLMPDDIPLISEADSAYNTKEHLPLALIVEDNRDMSRYIQQQLEGRYQLIAAHDGKQGLKMAQEHIPDIIICDLMMPEMNGYELCKKLKADQFSSHIPIILLTAKASGGSRIEGLQAGADDYMVKPFDAKELLARADNLIAQRKHLRALLGSATKTSSTNQLISSADAALIDRLLAIVYEHIADEHFDVDQLARQAGFSRAQLYRKVKALTDQSVSEYIQTIRLKRAAELILQHAGNFTEVAYQVGFKDPSYFSKCFRKQFDCLPSEYLAKKANT